MDCHGVSLLLALFMRNDVVAVPWGFSKKRHLVCVGVIA